MQDLADLPQQEAIANTLLEYWCDWVPAEQIAVEVPERFALNDFEVRSELATCDSVPRVHQERFEIGVRRNKSITKVTVGVSLAFLRKLSGDFGPIETINKLIKAYPKHQEPRKLDRWLCQYRISAQEAALHGFVP